MRDPVSRREEGALVLEGPTAVEDALDRGIALESVYFGSGAPAAFAALRTRLGSVPTAELKEGVLEKVGSTRTPQPVLGVVRWAPQPLDALEVGLVIVAVGVADPGNAGTLVRTAEAVGASGVVFSGESVDPANPKAVRASAGAILGVKIVVADDPEALLDALGAQGRRRIGTTATGGATYTEADLSGDLTLVLGSESHGLAPDVTRRLDGLVTIPMRGGESLNVAVAGSVLAFEWRRRNP